jgi:1-deoxy-D-xylulose-5-phosphate synthase
MRFVKPLDKELLHKIFTKFDKIITVEDGCLMGGFGSAILEFMADHHYTAKVIRLGIPDKLIEHGEQHELHRECGYDAEGIVKAVKSLAGLALKK